MADVKQAWGEVGSMFSSLGLKLKMHFEQARSAEEGAPGEEPPQGPAEAAEPSAEGDAGAGAAGAGPADTGPADAAELKAALRRLSDALDGVFDAAGHAVRDPAVKEDVRDIGKALSDAFSATFAEVSDDLRKAFRRRDDEPGPSS